MNEGSFLITLVLSSMFITLGSAMSFSNQDGDLFYTPLDLYCRSRAENDCQTAGSRSGPNEFLKCCKISMEYCISQFMNVRLTDVDVRCHKVQKIFVFCLHAFACQPLYIEDVVCVIV